MIPVEQKRDVRSSGVEGTASFEISGKDAAHIMTILRDTLYSDKILAVLREYAANAWDANRIAGRGDVPIEVTLPTYADPTLKIRDHGPGLSLEDVFEVYNKYGASTKRDSNTAVGMLGIGSKSGFAYSDSFTIVSWHGGTRSTYVAVIDDSEKGRLDLFDVQEDAEAPTGVEIQIAVKPHDINEFSRKAATLFAFFEPRPKINTTLPAEPKGWKAEGYGIVLEQDNNSYRGSGSWVAVMGCVPYTIKLDQLQGLSSSAMNVSGILWFDIGQLQIAASREELKYGDSTKENLVAKINGIIDKYVEHLLDGVDQLSQWERRLRVKQINDLYLPIPSSLKDYRDSHVSFDTTQAFKLKGKSYRGKIDTTTVVAIKKNTRLVFRNEKRLLQGYAFQDGDIIVDVVLDDLKARKELKEQITKYRIKGIPQINISQITWTRPAAAARSPVDQARAKAECLTLDVKNIEAEKKSTRWTPVTRVPLDQDIYVVLDSYSVNGFSDFYETYMNDKSLLESVGGVMPGIIGYRNTQAKPVNRAKLKGTDYRVWRDDGYVKLLLSQPNVAAGLSAKVWANVTAYGVYDHNIKEVGEDTPLGKFMKKALDGARSYGKFNYNIQSVIGRAFYSLKENVAENEWGELIKLYPLLNTFGRPDISVFGGTHRKYWIEYINMVDLHRKMDDLVKKVSNTEEQAA